MNTTYNAAAIELTTKLEWLSNSIGDAIPRIAGVAAIMKTLLLLILSDKNLSNVFFKYLKVKTVFDIIANLFGLAFNKTFCPTCTVRIPEAYWIFLYYRCLIRIPMRIFMMASFVTDILLTYNRCGLFLPNLRFRKCTADIAAILSVTFALCPFLLGLYSIDNVPLGTDSWAYQFRVPIGKTSGTLTFSLVFICEALIPMTYVIILTAVLAYQFNKYKKKGNELVLTKTQFGSVEFVLISSTLVIIIRLIDSIGNLWFGIEYFSNYKGGRTQVLSDLALQAVYLSQNIFYLLYFVNQSADLFINLSIHMEMTSAISERIKRFYKMVSIRLRHNFQKFLLLNFSFV